MDSLWLSQVRVLSRVYLKSEAFFVFYSNVDGL